MGWIINDVDGLRRIMEPLEERFGGDDEKIDQYMRRFGCGRTARKWRIYKDWHANPPGQNLEKLYVSNVKATPVEEHDDDWVGWRPQPWFRKRDRWHDDQIKNLPW